jgi:hypothetical protein
LDFDEEDSSKSLNLNAEVPGIADPIEPVKEPTLLPTANNTEKPPEPSETTEPAEPIVAEPATSRFPPLKDCSIEECLRVLNTYELEDFCRDANEMLDEAFDEINRSEDKLTVPVTKCPQKRKRKVANFSQNKKGSSKSAEKIEECTKTAAPDATQAVTLKPLKSKSKISPKAAVKAAVSNGGTTSEVNAGRTRTSSELSAKLDSSTKSVTEKGLTDPPSKLVTLKKPQLSLKTIAKSPPIDKASSKPAPTPGTLNSPTTKSAAVESLKPSAASTPLIPLVNNDSIEISSDDETVAKPVLKRSPPPPDVFSNITTEQLLEMTELIEKVLPAELKKKQKRKKTKRRYMNKLKIDMKASKIIEATASNSAPAKKRRLKLPNFRIVNKVAKSK